MPQRLSPQAQARLAAYQAWFHRLEFDPSQLSKVVAFHRALSEMYWCGFGKHVESLKWFRQFESVFDETLTQVIAEFSRDNIDDDPFPLRKAVN